ncbi:MAG: hypothetical protein HQK97_06060 [Nitrospirae bacterium]|nr:hypothetical protein [Nitrospirota bacterium]
MEKSAGVTQISDSTPSLTLTLTTGEEDIEKEAKALGKSVEDYKKEQRSMEILRKPQTQWTQADKRFLKDYDSIEANPAGNPVDAVMFALIGGPISGIFRAIVGNIVFDITMDEVMKYAEEHFSGYGAIGIALAVLALAVAKGHMDAKKAEEAQQKLIAATNETKAAEKAAAAEAEQKAAQEAENKAADAIAQQKAAEQAAQKQAALEAEKKAAEESAKASEKRGEWYDETKNNSALAKSDAEKEATKVNKLSTGEVKAGEAENLNQQAKKAGSDTRFDGYKTEASQERIQHSMEGHSDIKVELAKAREARGDNVSPKDKIPEEDIKGKAGKRNMPLTKEDYQNIEKYRNQAAKTKSPAEGRVVFQSIAGKKTIETVDYQARQKDGVIHMIYKVDPVNKKLKLVTMYKETEKVPRTYR